MLNLWVERRCLTESEMQEIRILVTTQEPMPDVSIMFVEIILENILVSIIIFFRNNATFFFGINFSNKIFDLQNPIFLVPSLLQSWAYLQAQNKNQNQIQQVFFKKYLFIKNKIGIFFL